MGGEQRLFADPRAIPAQPNVVISGMAAFALVDPVTASKYGVAVFCRWGPQRPPIDAAPDSTYEVHHVSHT